jgi:hypothetical protein
MKGHQVHFSYGKYYKKQRVPAPLCVTAVVTRKAIVADMAERNIYGREHVYSDTVAGISRR